MNPLTLIQSMLVSTPYKAFLFGSRANGTMHSRSDWDIAITGPSRIDSILLMNIEEAIEKANFIHKIDIVDMATVSSSFKKEIEVYMF